MDFIEAMKAENNLRKTLTENGAVAYATSGKEMLDFNFKLAGYRKASEEEIQRDFGRVYYEDPLLAVKFLFWCGDVREGAGERKVFRTGLIWLAEHKPEVAKAVIPLVGEYNRFDSLLPLLDTNLRYEVSSYYKKKLKEDKRNRKMNQPASLLGKWLPSINASSAESRRYAKMLCEDWGCTYEKYRKTLSKLRKYLDVVERKMSAKEWGDIDYNIVPSKANLIYNSAFLRNDTERRRKYLEDLTNGVKDVKINAGVLQPHEIVSKYTKSGWWDNSVKDYDETLEQLWKNLPNMTIDKMLICHDSSGSMTSRISGDTTCLDVATALAIYMSEKNSGEWKDKFITFSNNPQIIDLSNAKTLHDKLEIVLSRCEVANTDVYKTMKLVLDTAIHNNMSQNDMPQAICYCSDMQWDGRCFNFNKTLFEMISKEFVEAGYKLPKIIFWNICDRNRDTIPMQQNEYGLILCSGFSVQIMQMFMSGEIDPYKVLLETINSQRYQPIEIAVRDILQR